eukprot:scaffold1846_cov236-Pinguiococcus_pyrenoidosus.AAC.1
MKRRAAVRPSVRPSFDDPRIKKRTDPGANDWSEGEETPTQIPPYPANLAPPKLEMRPFRESFHCGAMGALWTPNVRPQTAPNSGDPNVPPPSAVVSAVSQAWFGTSTPKRRQLSTWLGNIPRAC